MRRGALLAAVKMARLSLRSTRNQEGSWHMHSLDLKTPVVEKRWQRCVRKVEGFVAHRRDLGEGAWRMGMYRVVHKAGNL